IASADAPDSQEICFIPDNDYPNYIDKLGYKGKNGKFIAPDGKVLGEHKGVLNYTVGQRRGLGIALGKPVFVKNILPSGDIQLAFSGDEFCTDFTLCDIFTVDCKGLNGSATVKIRSAAKPVECSIKTENGETTVHFSAPIRAAAPGQSAVFYDGEKVLGGGFIEKVLGD
ncbi:MAG: aminomethyltransferase beta-barrel domain-containing protein, partial [Oscillospiraceae bacterium]